MTRCPTCRHPVHSLRPTPAPARGHRPHLTVSYPCGCWHTPTRQQKGAG